MRAPASFPRVACSMIIVRHPITRKARHCRRCLVTPPHSYHMLCPLLPFHDLYLRLLLRCGKSLRQTTKADSNNYYSSRLILSPMPTIPSDPATHYRHDHHDYISPFPVPCTGTSQPRRPRQTTARPQSSSSTPLNLLDKDC